MPTEERDGPGRRPDGGPRRPGERPGRVGRRIMRRTLQPRRPLVFPDQWGLVLLTALALIAGLAFVVVALLFSVG